MANKKISELVSRTPSLTDLMLVGDPSSGYSYKCTVNDIALQVELGVAGNYVTLATAQTISGAKTFSNVLTLTSVANSAVDTDKFLVLTGTNTVNYRTGAEVLSDIGGASAALYVPYTGATTDVTLGNRYLKASSLVIEKSTSASGALHFKQGSTTEIDFSTNYTAISARAQNFMLFAFNQGNSFDYKNFQIDVANITTGTTRTYTMPNASGTLALTSDITGAISGTTNYIPKFTSSTAIGNSVIYESSSNIGIGLTSPSARLHVNGTGRFEGGVYASEVYLSSPNNIVGIVDSTNANGGFLQFSTSSTVIAEMGASQSVIGSGGNDLFALNAKGSRDLILATNATERVRIASTGAITLSTIANATTDTDKFLVSDSGVIKYRTGAELLSDIGGASSASISGTTNYIPKFTSSSAIGNSVIYESGNNIGIGSTSPSGFTRTLKINTASGTAGVLLADGDTDRAGFYIDAGTTAPAYLFTNNSKPLVFSVAGSERMRLDASGNLGLGTSSPASKLSVGGDGYSGRAITAIGNAAAYAVTIRQDGTNGSGLQIFHNTSSWGTGVPLKIATSTTDFLTLDASGNLGLGVTPASWATVTPLQIKNAAFIGFGETAYMSGNAYFNAGWKYIASSGAGRYDIDGGSGGEHRWSIAASGVAGNSISFTQAMTLDASGRLGIGVTSLNNNLEVYQTGTAGNNYVEGTVKVGGSTSSFGAALSYASQNSGYVSISNLNNSGGANARINFGFGAVTSGSPAFTAMTINQSGNVGIGTTSPTSRLDVKETTANTYGVISVRGENRGGGLELYNGTSLTAAIYSLSTNDLLFYTGTGYSERMRITSTGNVGIGTSSPTNKLAIETSSANGGYDLNFSGSTFGRFGIVNPGTSNDTYIGAVSNNNFLFYSNNTERMRITSGGELLINTTSDAGDYKLQVNGNSYFNGVVFAKDGLVSDKGASNSIAVGSHMALSNPANSYQYLLQLNASYGLDFWNYNGTWNVKATLSSGGNLDLTGSIKTAAPSGGTAQPWKLGSKVTAAALTMNTTDYIEVEVNGVAYKLALIN